MSRRICLALLVASFALGAPATSLAQSSSQAQYQGVAPETQTPVTGPGGSGTGGGNATNGGANGTGGTAATGGGTSGTSGASGNGGGAATSTPAAGSAQSRPTASSQASSDTGPFSGGDFVLIVLACAGLAGLGLVLRRATRRDPAGA
jgi:cobalamin biosynthesis Mg chelatase CobN